MTPRTFLYIIRLLMALFVSVLFGMKYGFEEGVMAWCVLMLLVEIADGVKP
jgi:hypothetical protein